MGAGDNGIGMVCLLVKVVNMKGFVVHTFSLFATPTSVAADTGPFVFAWACPIW